MPTNWNAWIDFSTDSDRALINGTIELGEPLQQPLMQERSFLPFTWPGYEAMSKKLNLTCHNSSERDAHSWPLVVCMQRVQAAQEWWGEGWRRGRIPQALQAWVGRVPLQGCAPGTPLSHPVAWLPGARSAGPRSVDSTSSPWGRGRWKVLSERVGNK